MRRIGVSRLRLAAGACERDDCIGGHVEFAFVEFAVQELRLQRFDIERCMRLRHQLHFNERASNSPARSASTSAASDVTGAGKRVAQRPIWLTMCASLPPMPRYPSFAAISSES